MPATEPLGTTPRRAAARAGQEGSSPAVQDVRGGFHEWIDLALARPVHQLPGPRDAG